jgi:hypothetical protein
VDRFQATSIVKILRAVLSNVYTKKCGFKDKARKSKMHSKCASQMVGLMRGWMVQIISYILFQLDFTAGSLISARVSGWKGRHQGRAARTICDPHYTPFRTFSISFPGWARASFAQRYIKAQYQDEFYRRSDPHSTGFLVALPEYRNGEWRVDFTFCLGNVVWSCYQTVVGSKAGFATLWMDLMLMSGYRRYDHIFLISGHRSWSRHTPMNQSVPRFCGS